MCIFLFAYFVSTTIMKIFHFFFTGEFFIIIRKVRLGFYRKQMIRLRIKQTRPSESKARWLSRGWKAKDKKKRGQRNEICEVRYNFIMMMKKDLRNGSKRRKGVQGLEGLLFINVCNRVRNLESFLMERRKGQRIDQWKEKEDDEPQLSIESSESLVAYYHLYPRLPESPSVLARESQYPSTIKEKSP